MANNTQESEGGNLIEFITDAALRVVAARGRIGEVRLGVPSVSPTYLCNYGVE